MQHAQQLIPQIQMSHIISSVSKGLSKIKLIVFVNKLHYWGIVINITMKAVTYFFPIYNMNTMLITIYTLALKKYVFKVFKFNYNSFDFVFCMVCFILCIYVSFKH